MFLQSLVLVLIVVHESCGKHFHGGSMSWKPINNGEQIQLTYRVGFKFYHQEAQFNPCTAEAQQDRSILRAGGNLVCNSCSGKDASQLFTWICDDYDLQLDSSVGGNVVEYDIPSGQTKFEISHENCCWTKLASPDRGSGARGFNLMTEVNVEYREDIQGINSSPVSAPIPVQKFHGGCIYHLQIAANDPDNDIVQCRNMKQSECPKVSGRGRACGKSTSGLEVMKNCTLIFDTSIAGQGHHAANIMIRDCPNRKCKKPYSKVPLLFLLDVADEGETCVKPSIIQPPSPSCRAIRPNERFEMMVVAEAGDPSLPVTKFYTDKPMGMDASELRTVTGHPDRKAITLSWLPSSEQLGEHTVSFSALDSEGFTSGLSSTFIIVTNEPPFRVDKDASTPAEGAEHKVSEPWVIRFTGQITRPKTNAHIHIVDGVTDVTVYSANAKNTEYATFYDNAIELNPNQDLFPFLAGGATHPYSIRLDEGVAVPATGGCPSEADEWTIDLTGNDNYAIRPINTCQKSDPPSAGPAKCAMVLKQLVVDETGEGVSAAPQNLCCRCIDAPSSPGYDASPPGSR